MPTFQLSFFLLGCLGGSLPDLLRFARNRYKSGVKGYLKTLNFWGGLLILVLLGGITAWVLDTSTAKDALIFGYASPQIISELVGSATASKSRTSLGEIDEDTKITNWWGM